MRRKTRPTIDDSLIGPKNRASFDAVRLSPITKMCPAGTLHPGLPSAGVPHPGGTFGSDGSWSVCVPFGRYGSFSR